ncbi:MAG: DUF4136 domain-containing protein [Calditrichae bacterium]|nr:DUF4136 domain-containing protein [Calditrichia bacterium]
MMRNLTLLAIMVIFLITLCSCSSVNVKTDYDTDFDFSGKKTFGFLPVPADAGINQLDANRVSKAIKSQLTPKGFTLSEKADFGVAIHFGKQTKTDIQSWGYGYGRWGAWGGGGVDVMQYDEGTLVIDFINMKNKKLIWRGSGETIMDDTSNMDKHTKNINEVVTKILADFPPTAKAK